MVLGGLRPACCIWICPDPVESVKVAQADRIESQAGRLHLTCCLKWKFSKRASSSINIPTG